MPWDAIVLCEANRLAICPALWACSFANPFLNGTGIPQNFAWLLAARNQEIGIPFWTANATPLACSFGSPHGVHRNDLKTPRGC